MSVTDEARRTGRARWDGKPGRLEVWYATFTDRASGAGGWIHCETVAPDRSRAGAHSTGDGSPYAHGWISWFPTAGSPTTARFGPVPTAPVSPATTSDDRPWFEAAGCTVGPGVMKGTAPGTSWDLRWHDEGRPLYTFPRLAWERELLPAAQIVVAPTATIEGTIDLRDAEGATQHLDVAATGGLAHIYGQGNALRWGWLHADLGDGDLLEIVTAVSKKPGLNRLRPVCFARFRVSGTDWPASGLPGFRLRTQLGGHEWSVNGRIGRRRIAVTVRQPQDRCVALSYHDPDGETATCTNTERADVEVVVERRAGGTWVTEHRWQVVGTAHAELGSRP